MDKDIFNPGQTDAKCSLTPNSLDVYRLSFTIKDEDIKEDISQGVNYLTYLFPVVRCARDSRYRRYESLITNDSEQKIIKHIIEVLRSYGIVEYTYSVSTVGIKR